MNNKFGETLRSFREEKQMTQQVLATICNTTKYSISAWELGKQEPNIDMILKLADFFDVTVGQLLGTEEY